MQNTVKILTKTGCTLCETPIFICKKLKNNYPNIKFLAVNIDNK